MTRRCLAVVMLAASVFSSVAEISITNDWPQFQGPNRDGISLETGIAKTWPEGGPPVLWQVTLGQGYAGAVVQDGKVYLLDRKNDAEDILRCFDLENGSEIFSIACKAPGSGHVCCANWLACALALSLLALLVQKYKY